MNVIINKTQLDIQGWEYLQKLFPKTVEEIMDWYFSYDDSLRNFCITTKELSFKLKYHDRMLYDYFDSLKINIMVFKKEKKFICNVNSEKTSLNDVFFFYERYFADICGFINAMNIRENALL